MPRATTGLEGPVLSVGPSVRSNAERLRRPQSQHQRVSLYAVLLPNTNAIALRHFHRWPERIPRASRAGFSFCSGSAVAPRSGPEKRAISPVRRRTCGGLTACCQRGRLQLGGNAPAAAPVPVSTIVSVPALLAPGESTLSLMGQVAFSPRAAPSGRKTTLMQNSNGCFFRTAGCTA